MARQAKAQGHKMVPFAGVTTGATIGINAGTKVTRTDGTVCKLSAKVVTTAVTVNGGIVTIDLNGVMYTVTIEHTVSLD